MDAGNAHRPGLGVQAGGERTQRQQPPADPVLRLQDDRVVALLGELERRDQAGDPGADDDDALARPSARLQAGGQRH